MKGNFNTDILYLHPNHGMDKIVVIFATIFQMINNSLSS